MTPDAILDEIRRLYFAATPQSIEQDFDRAIDLLKLLPDEASRERATVFMEGLAAMKTEFGHRQRSKPPAQAPTRPGKD
jgi:hypothetical protein